MSQISTLLSLPFIQPSQAQKHVTHNVAIERLDLLVQLVLQGIDQQTPPASVAEGQAWATGDAPTGDWAGHPREIIAWQEGGWVFVPPRPGWQATDLATGQKVVFDGISWQVPATADLKLVPGPAPANPVAGQVYFDAVSAKLRCFDGTIWQDLF